jgi:hypothetical protein
MSSCNTNADPLGRFTFHDVRPGNERVEAGHAGYRKFSPVPIVVTHGDTLLLELRLKAGGPLEDCRVNPGCARLFQGSPPVSLSDEEEFRLSTLATTIAVAWNVVATANPWHACVEEASAAVSAELGRRYGPVVPRAECAIDGDRVRHTASGAPGFFVMTRGVRDLGVNRRTALLVYMVAGLWGEGWDCMFERPAQGWQPLQCVLKLQF